MYKPTPDNRNRYQFPICVQFLIIEPTNYLQLFHWKSSVNNSMSQCHILFLWNIQLIVTPYWKNCKHKHMQCCGRFNCYSKCYIFCLVKCQVKCHYKTCVSTINHKLWQTIGTCADLSLELPIELSPNSLCTSTRYGNTIISYYCLHWWCKVINLFGVQCFPLCYFMILFV